MKKRNTALIVVITFALIVIVVALSNLSSDNHDTNHESILENLAPIILEKPDKPDLVSNSTETYRNFSVNNILHSKQYGDIHYNVYIPQNYDGSKPYALFLTTPGYEGLYFQGIAQNLKEEDFGFEAQKYNDEMIIIAPQLSDWEEMSANQAITLIEYFLQNYNIDPSKIYANGYSCGGQTMSIAVSKRPDLFTAYLHVSSTWDGEIEPIVNNRLPIYLVIGKNDEYYGSNPTLETYNNLYSLYRDQGLSETEINELLVLDIKEHTYFTNRGMSNEHAAGATILARDQEIMNWLFKQ